MGGVGSGDKLARGGYSATWGPIDVSKEKWEAIFGQESNIVNLKDIPVSDGSGAVSYRFTRKKKSLVSKRMTIAQYSKAVTPSIMRIIRTKSFDAPIKNKKEKNNAKKKTSRIKRKTS